ncbi:MAG: FkbM family methyltransferase [Mucilaginibacter sp.]
MRFIKRLFPNSIKQEGKYFLYDLLKMPYNRYDVPLEIVNWLPNDKPITFIDIGASVGHFSTSITGHYKIDRGLLIEPLSQWTGLLKSKFPDDERFKILNLAVAQTDGELDFYISDDFDSISSLFKINTDFSELSDIQIKEPVKTKVQAKTLDKIVSENGLSTIDLIKIDVQGAEHLVLNSGANTLKATKLVYTEFSYKPLYEGSSVFFDIYKIMSAYNFRMVEISPGYRSVKGEVLQGDALFVNNDLV